MIPIISFVGYSGTGKTTLLEKIVVELKKRGLKIAVIKHVPHNDLEFDKEGKDSSRYVAAGADEVVLSGRRETIIMKKSSHDMTPQQVSAMLDDDTDLILAEGFKNIRNVKIEVHRKEMGHSLLTDAGHLLAVVTDEPLDIAVPQFEFSSNPETEIADLIEKWLVFQRKNRVGMIIDNDSELIQSYRIVKN
jgi:molybdopterin-guanine dinucleotide biosynthesis protein MobB